MAGSSEVVFISVNYNITLIGKIWFILMVFLRVLVLLLAGYPLYQDEQERFVCNTIQPGCANVCYDLFSPVSLFRFWLVQVIALCLPFFVFVMYVVHKISNGLLPPGRTAQRTSAKKTFSSGSLQGGGIQFFTGAYVLHLAFRTLLEVGFGAAHYYLFGFYVPRRFLCQQPPCTTQVDCYISRPTEKTVMLNFMLGVAATSLFLNVLDFFCAVKRSVQQKKRRTAAAAAAEGIYEEAQANRDLTGDPGPAAGSFRKRNTNGNNGCSQVDGEGSDVALCPPESVAGTPRSIRVSKRGRLKPPPPPRRDLVPDHDGRPPQVGSHSFDEMDLQTSSEGPEKRSHWV